MYTPFKIFNRKDIIFFLQRLEFEIHIFYVFQILGVVSQYSDLHINHIYNKDSLKHFCC